MAPDPIDHLGGETAAQNDSITHQEGPRPGGDGNKCIAETSALGRVGGPGVEAN